MNRSLNKDNRNAKIISRINNGASWEELESEFKLSKSHMQACLRVYYKQSSRYNAILARARKNSNGKKDTDAVIHIAETGALLVHPTLLYHKKRVFVPEFCKKEIDSISSKEETNRSNILNNNKICWTNIRWEHIVVPKDVEVKPRTISVVAFCCAMAKRNRPSKVKLYTNSYAIEKLIAIQNVSNIEVVKF